MQVFFLKKFMTLKLKKKKRVFLILIFSLIFIVTYNFYYAPLKSESIQLDEKIERIKINNKSMQAEKTHYLKINTKKEERVDQDKQDSLVVEAKDINSTLVELEKMMEDNNIYFNNMSINSGSLENEKETEKIFNSKETAGLSLEEEFFIDIINLELDLKGDYYDVLNFIKSLEAYEGPCVINGVELQGKMRPKENEEDRDKLTHCRLDLFFYWSS